MDGGGTRVGAASFGVGIDLAQFERDLDRAEQLARSRATRIQAALGSAPVAPAVTGTVAPRAASSGGAGRISSVPAYVQTLYDGAVAQGMSDADAKRSIARTLGLRVSDLDGIGGGPAASAAAVASVVSRDAATQNRQAQRQVAQQMRADQQRAERDARLQGRSFSNVRTGRTVNTPEAAPPSARPGVLDSLFSQSPGTTIRAAGALVGIGLGLSAVVGIASQIHQVIVDTVEATVNLSQAARQVGVSFGDAGRQFTGSGATAFAANPLTRGSQQQYLTAVAGLGPIANQFGLTNDQVKDLVTSEGALARLHGVELPQAAQVLQQVLRGNVEAGQALDLQLVDQYGRLRSVGLSFDELVQSVGRARAEQQLFRDIQVDVARQLQNGAQNTDTLSNALDRLQKAIQAVQDRAAKGVAGPAAGVAGGAADLIGGNAPSTGTAPSIGTAFGNLLNRPDLRTLLAFGASFFPQAPPYNPTQGQIDSAVNAQNTSKLDNELAGNSQSIGARQADQLDVSARRSAVTEQANRAQIQQNAAQAQIDRLNAESDLRQLSVQGQFNTLARDRIQIEQQLAPILLEQQQIQDRITLATRENLDLRERTLRAQLAATGPNAAAQDLTYEQQRVRLQAEVQQSRAIRGLGPAAGIASVPELFGQAFNLALAAPAVQLAALDATHRVDVNQRAQQADQLSKQVGAIPLQAQLQDVQPQAIGLQEAQGANDAAQRAAQAMLDITNIIASPALIKAEQDRAAALLTQADAASKLATIQAAGGINLNASATVTFDGLSNVSALVESVITAFRPQLTSAINDAVNNPRPPSGGPLDRGNR